MACSRTGGGVGWSVRGLYLVAEKHLTRPLSLMDWGLGEGRRGRARSRKVLNLSGRKVPQPRPQLRRSLMEVTGLGVQTGI